MTLGLLMLFTWRRGGQGSGKTCMPCALHYCSTAEDVYNMKKFIYLLAAACLLLPACFEERLFSGARLVVLFTGDTLGEIEPCG